MMLRVAGIVNDSIVDGPGIRCTIFVQGCPHKCDGCHNEHTHDFNGGMLMSFDEIMTKIETNPLLDGVTFSGGEPFCQAMELAQLGDLIHQKGLNIITYTGYTFEYLYENRDKNGIIDLLKVTDLLIDGPFVKSLKTYKHCFRGSSNQRIIDCGESLIEGHAIETDI